MLTHIYIFLNIFTEPALRPVQSISCDVFVSVCLVVCAPPPPHLKKKKKYCDWFAIGATSCTHQEINWSPVCGISSDLCRGQNSQKMSIGVRCQNVAVDKWPCLGQTTSWPWSTPTVGWPVDTSKS